MGVTGQSPQAMRRMNPCPFNMFALNPVTELTYLNVKLTEAIF